MIILIVLIFIFKFNKIILDNYFELNKGCLNINMYFNLSFPSKILNKIKIATFTFYLENGGRSRITSFLLNYLSKIKIFNIYLFTNKIKNNNEYLIQKQINRILIKNYKINKLIREIVKKKINIFIHQFPYSDEIEHLNKLKSIKVLYYQHQSIFFWIYSNSTSINSIYKSYIASKYIVSLIHLENDFIFKKWGIKSIIMNNFISYEYNSSFEIDLSSKAILMFGRADNKYKRFELGIQAMEYITNEIPKIEMKIITNITNVFYLKNIMNNLNLENNINIYDYTPIPEKYFRNVSLNILTSISESFSLVLSETKIYGIPNILIGLDYLSIANGGIVIIYDDSPELIAKESINILINDNYRKNLGKAARRSMKKFKNKVLLKKWIKLILSIYFGNDYYEKLRKSDKKISEIKALNILKIQINLLKKRKIKLKYFNLNINNFIFI